MKSLNRLNLRHRGVQIISCPSCAARQGFDVIKTVGILEKKLEHINPYFSSIIGCVVNGPGEALMTDIGLPGGGAGSGMIYKLGKTDHKLDNDNMIDHIVGRSLKQRAKELSENNKFFMFEGKLKKIIDRFEFLEKEMQGHLDRTN